MKTKPPIATVALAVLAVLVVGAGLLLMMGGDRLHSRARKQWKENAVAVIGRRVSDTNWLATEIAAPKQGATENDSDAAVWFSDRLILMASGEWVVYAAKCSKEDWRIHDIFIGRGSDGRWYYSTFHFCKGMVVLRMEEQPQTLAKFVESYCLREFDGRSDDCLQKTWPPERR